MLNIVIPFKTYYDIHHIIEVFRDLSNYYNYSDFKDKSEILPAIEKDSIIKRKKRMLTYV
jgi:hypothetical protein